jgi:hypothetical protein
LVNEGHVNGVDKGVAVSSRLVRDRILSFVISKVQKTSHRARLRVNEMGTEVLEIIGNPASVYEDTTLFTLGVEVSV